MRAHTYSRAHVCGSEGNFFQLVFSFHLIFETRSYFWCYAVYRSFHPILSASPPAVGRLGLQVTLLYTTLKKKNEF